MQLNYYCPQGVDARLIKPTSENLRGSFIENAFSVEAIEKAIAVDAREGCMGCVFLGDDGALLPKTEVECE